MIIKVYEGVEFREIQDPEISLDGYWVGKDGRVFSCWKAGKNPVLTGSFRKELSVKLAANGVARVSFRNGIKRTVSRLVYSAFIGQISDSEVVFHVDGNPLNNTPDNLCTAMNGYHVNHQRLHPKALNARQRSVMDLLKAGMSLREVSNKSGEPYDFVKRIRRKISST